jgi:DNA polymerase I-like protein with 3'-5' exonuclease and polymerase domains
LDTEQLLDVFHGLIASHKLDVRVNEVPREIKSPIALDVEHDESGNFVGVGFTSDGHIIYYFSDLLLFNRIDFHAVSIIAHNGRSDWDCLKQWGINVRDEQLYHDTELMGHILDSSRHGFGLKTLAEADLGVVYPSYDDVVGRRTLKQVKERKTLDKQPQELVALYNAMDVFATYQLYLSQQKYNKQCSQYFEDIERPIAFLLQDMENRGICVDLEYLKKLKINLENQLKPIEEEIINELGRIG